MKQTINFYHFERAFVEMGRENNFTYAGKKALFDYLEELENDTGMEMELDIIALCCDYTEYENMEDFWINYGSDELKTLDDIRDRTTVIPVNDSAFILNCF